MKDFQHAVGVLLGLCTLTIFHVQTVNANLMNVTCQAVLNGEIGDPEDCRSFGFCKDGKLTNTFMCRAGELYDMDLGSCQIGSNVHCRTTMKDRCYTAGVHGFYVDPNNCKRYCYCDAHKIEACFECPDDQLFDSITGNPQCVWKDDHDGCLEDSLCRLVRNGKMIADPNKCGDYLECSKGFGVKKSCPLDNYNFNPKTGECDEKFVCPMGDPKPAVCETYDDDDYGKPIFIGDDKTCYGYYVCTSKTGPGLWNTCPFATHFNPSTSQCVTPYQYNCPYNRCGNLNLPFVTTAKTRCKEYNVCTDGTTTFVGQSCKKPGFPYFDEVIGACVASRPDYAICKN